MAHIAAQPGTPLYDAHAGPDGAIEAVRRDVDILTGAGFDARVVTELPAGVPFGLDGLTQSNVATPAPPTTGWRGMNRSYL
jgi:hypothetical protein